MTKLAQVKQAPLRMGSSLAENLFAKVLQNHALVMYEQHPGALVDGLQRQMSLIVNEFRTSDFYAFENARHEYRQKLFDLAILLSDAQMAYQGYPIVFRDMSFLGTTKKFENGTWPLFYLLDPNVSKRFGILASPRSDITNFFPRTLPADLVRHYSDTAKEVPFNNVLITENSKPAPKWAREHMRRAENLGYKLFVIGEASKWEIVREWEMEYLEPTFIAADPIVICQRDFHYNLGPDLGSLTTSRYYVVTAYDPTAEEVKILRSFTQFY